MQCRSSRMLHAELPFPLIVTRALAKSQQRSFSSWRSMRPASALDGSIDRLCWFQFRGVFYVAAGKGIQGSAATYEAFMGIYESDQERATPFATTKMSRYTHAYRSLAANSRDQSGLTCALRTSVAEGNVTLSLCSAVITTSKVFDVVAVFNSADRFLSTRIAPCLIASCPFGRTQTM